MSLTYNVNNGNELCEELVRSARQTLVIVQALLRILFKEQALPEG
jgi:hypothetical protein